MSNKVSRLKKISVHDINNRSKAVAVINGEVYFGRIHSDCIDEYLEQYKGDNCYSYYKSQLPDEFDAANRHEDGYELEVNYEKIAFGHVDEKNKAIYIEPNTLQNMTLDEAAKILKEKCPDYNVYNDGTYDGTYENIWDKNDEIQKHMSTNPEDYEQIAGINSRLKKKIARHDYDNRDCALMMVNGKIYVGDTHFDCVEDYKIDNVDCDEVAMRHHEDMNVNDEKMAFGHIDKKQKAIFIEPDTLQNMNIQEAANIIKQQYPDYDIYNDGTYGNEDIFNQNLSNNLEDYKKIANINRLKKISQHDYCNRDCALMIANGKVFVGDKHYDCVIDYEENDNINPDEIANRHENVNVNDEKLAFGHIDKKQKAIFIEPDTLQNMTLQEAADIVKQQYPDYGIYNDGTYDSSKYCNKNFITDLNYYTKIASVNYNIHDIVNKLYRTMPLVPTGDLIQDIYQDIQNGEYKICGDPNTNWEKWQDRCKELLSERGIIYIMDDRNYISANPIKQKDWNIIKTSKLKKKSEKSYTWDEVVKITIDAGKSSCEPFGDYSNNEFVLEEVPISKIPNSDYLTLDECKEYDMDEDESIILYLENIYMDGKNLPPVILDNNYKIIDGSHRIGMYEDLGINTIKAFVLKK